MQGSFWWRVDIRQMDRRPGSAACLSNFAAALRGKTDPHVIIHNWQWHAGSGSTPQQRPPRPSPHCHMMWPTPTGGVPQKTAKPCTHRWGSVPQSCTKLRKAGNTPRKVGFSKVGCFRLAEIFSTLRSFAPTLRNFVQLCAALCQLCAVLRAFCANFAQFCQEPPQTLCSRQWHLVRRPSPAFLYYK